MVLLYLMIIFDGAKFEFCRFLANTEEWIAERRIVHTSNKIILLLYFFES